MTGKYEEKRRERLPLETATTHGSALPYNIAFIR
jgi:hypothetical protein